MPQARARDAMFPNVHKLARDGARSANEQNASGTVPGSRANTRLPAYAEFRLPNLGTVREPTAFPAFKGSLRETF
jgi:hypothetical protein